MSNSWLIKAASALLNVLCCALVLALVLRAQSGFGQGDTSAFLCWTMPLALAIALGGRAGLVPSGSAWSGIRLLGILLMAAALAYGWGWVVYLALGASINSFSFPIFQLWFAGNCAQLLFPSRYLPASANPNGVGRRLARLLLIPLFGVGGVLLLFVLSFVGSYLTRPEKELYLIPADFRGTFRVIYGQPCGSSPGYEQGRRVLRVPADGLLLIQPPLETGWIDNEYYLVDKAGHRQKIAELQYYPEKKPTVPGVLLRSTGSFGGAMPDGSNSSESPLALHYADFQVFTKDAASSLAEPTFRQDQAFDSLMWAKVAACRRASGKTN